MADALKPQDGPGQITQVAVLGAGTMGRGIAHISALAGYTTNLFDVAADQLGAAVLRVVQPALHLSTRGSRSASSTRLRRPAPRSVWRSRTISRRRSTAPTW